MELLSNNVDSKASWATAILFCIAFQWGLKWRLSRAFYDPTVHACRHSCVDATGLWLCGNHYLVVIILTLVYYDCLLIAACSCETSFVSLTRTMYSIEHRWGAHPRFVWYISTMVLHLPPLFFVLLAEAE